MLTAITLALCVTATGETPVAAPAVTVVVSAPPRAADAVRKSLTSSDALPVQLQWAELPKPAAPAPPTLELDAQVAAARHAWVNADFATCISTLDNDTARAALAAGKRGLVARWLAWRAACLSRQGRTPEASRTAELLATWELEPPPDLAGMTPDVETLIIDAARKASLTPRSRLELSGPVGAVVAVDGRPGVCSLPCTMTLVPGPHTLQAEPIGFRAAVRWHDLPAAGDTLTLQFEAASPQLAASQWAAHFFESPDADSPSSLALLSTALEANRLVWVSTDEETKRFVGVLSVAGSVVARITRDDGAVALMRDLLIQGKVTEPAPALYRRPLFWVGVVLAAAIAATVTAIVLTREVHSSVSF